ncbi:MAG: 50S ribosomal protein L5 [Parcubacteria group bacterium]|jgi:large subunit ribosomal protein L5
MISIREKYSKEIVEKMKKELNLSNDFEVPKIKKVVVNIGIGKFLKDSAQVEDIAKTLTVITGQKPLPTKAKKSIAGFKTREGLEIGMKVTLRGKRMWSFIERLVKAALPRVKDFHGLKTSAVDTSGNLNIGIKEQLIFPEILPEQVKNTFSLEVTVVTDAQDRAKGLALVKLLGFPMEIKQ